MSTPTFTMFHADCVGNAVNCLYSHKVEIADADTFRQAVRFDHVYRDMENYMAQRGMEPWTEAHERTSGIHMMYP